MGSETPEDLDSFILSSRYRKIVIEHLAMADQLTPNEIAERCDAQRPHISRALSQLREKGVVELRVSEHTNVGRYYGLTSKGEAAWDRLKKEIHGISKSFESPQDDQSEEVLNLALDEFGDALRFVGEYRDNEITIFYSDEDALAEYSEEEIDEYLRKFVYQLSLNEASVGNADLHSEVKYYGKFIMLRVHLDNSHHLSLSCDNGTEIPFPSLAMKIKDIYE